jgi:hypothetical protein
MIPLRGYAASTNGIDAGEAAGPFEGPFGIDPLRERAVEAARFVGDEDLAHELSEVCCWAPAATAIRQRPLQVQARGAQYFFQTFPGGEQLADVMQYSNNTAWRQPQFSFQPKELVERHYAALQKSQRGVRTEVVTPHQLRGNVQGDLGLMLDRETGDRLAKASERAEPMWAALSVFSGMMLDPSDDLSRRLTPSLSLNRSTDRALARGATVTYSQIVIGAIQRAVWSDMLDGDNPALPLVQLTASGLLPLGEQDGRFLLLQPATNGRRLIGYQTGSV